MPYIKTYTTVEETVTTIHDLAVRRDLAGVIKQWKDISLFDPTIDPANYVESVSWKTSFWLFPKWASLPEPLVQGNLGYPDNGWISISIGDVFEREGVKMLTPTTIDVIDHKELPFRPGNWIRQLRNDLVSTYGFTYGLLAVQGDNQLRYYADRSYSPGAKTLLDQQVHWKDSLQANWEFVPG